MTMEHDLLPEEDIGSPCASLSREPKSKLFAQTQSAGTSRPTLSRFPAFKKEPQVLIQPSQQPLSEPPTNLPADFNNPLLLNTLVTTMERISLSHDLPVIEIQKFDGSPQSFPVFRHRFEQLINSKPIDDSAKMSRLLQLLEGPPLEAVRRYEAVSGGLAKAPDLLQELFGQPCQIVRACVDTLTKGPSIGSNDNVALQKFVDEAQVMFETLKSMNSLAEMNVDNLEKIISRLPKWMQSKFAEHLKKIELGGRAMPTFKDVVDFLRERANVANHPFFSNLLTGSKGNCTLYIDVCSSDLKQLKKEENL